VTGAGAGARTARLLRLVIAAELLGLLVFGIWTVARFPMWALVDEGAHYAYVQQIAEHLQLPVLGRTYASQAVLAITHHADVARYHVDPATQGLGGLSYEAFQPPLYYVVAAPVFAAVPGYVAKVYALRAFGLLLLLAAVWLSWRLCVAVLGTRWRYGLALVLAVLVMPGVLVRSVTVSNEALTLPVALAFVLVAWHAMERPTTRRVLAAGALLGACLLTQVLLLALVPVYLVLLWHHVRAEPSRATDPRTLAVALLPALLVAPWIGFNLAEYHALTADSLAVTLQTPVVNPHHVHYGLHQLPLKTTDALWHVLLPQEWFPGATPGAPGHPLVYWVDDATSVVLFPALAVAMVAAGRRLLTGRAALLVLPYLTVTVLLWIITFGQQWDVMLGRYAYFALPGWVLFGALALARGGSWRLVAASATALAGVVLACWAVLAPSLL